MVFGAELRVQKHAGLNPRLNPRHPKFATLWVKRVVSFNGSRKKFTPTTVTFANSKRNLHLIDGSQLVDWTFEYYEKFDAKYKSTLPLRKVYLPQIVEG